MGEVIPLRRHIHINENEAENQIKSLLKELKEKGIVRTSIIWRLECNECFLSIKAAMEKMVAKK